MGELVRLASLNVKGANLAIKRKKILMYLKQEKHRSGFLARDPPGKEGLPVISQEVGRKRFL